MRPEDHHHVERILDRDQLRQQRMQEIRAAVEPEMEAAGLGAGASKVLVAEGDSWFDYPGTDVLEELEDGFGWDVKSVAHRGDILESMAYSERQLDSLNRRLRKLADHSKVPRAILISAGGNDIAGDELASLLNHALSGLDPLNEDVVRGIIDVRLRSALVSMIDKIGAFCDAHFDQPELPIVLHGYDYPVPDGRGFWSGWGPLPGPWLKPSFERKGYGELAFNVGVMENLIDRFNAMTASLESDHVHYVDLRRTLSNELAEDRYRDDWDNELHPEGPGFVLVAAKLHARLMTL